MSRKPRKYKRVVTPDPKYNSREIAQFINKLMIGGKKSTAQRIVYQALETLSKEVSEPVAEAFKQVIKNVTPLMEVRSRRVGGSTYQVPMEVRAERGISLAMRWLVVNARKRSGKSMVEKLSSEFVEAFNGSGTSVKKREETHKMAESNKAFAHFRW